MVPLLIYLLFKKKGIKLTSRLWWLIKRKFTSFYGIIAILLAMMLLITCSLFAQHTRLNYKVVQNDDVIGWLSVGKNDSANTSLIKLSLEIKKRIIFLISVIEREEASFLDGVMQTSYVYRKVNGNVKVNQYTQYAGNYYTVNREESLEQVLINGIRYNQLSMYVFEPENIKQIYSDNFRCLVNIEKTGNSSYKIRLPDGNTNYYYYANGVCLKLRMEHSLFTLEFILSP